MADVDTEGMKSTLAELSRRASAGSRVRRPPRDQPPPKSEVELRSLLESDPSVAKLASVLTQRLAERVAAQKVAQAEQRAQAEIDNATTAKIADAIEAERAALELLAQSNAETFVTLTKPLFIAQLPQTEYGQFNDQHIEPFNSWFKVDINDSSGGTGLEHHLTAPTRASSPTTCGEPERPIRIRQREEQHGVARLGCSERFRRQALWQLGGPLHHGRPDPNPLDWLGDVSRQQPRRDPVSVGGDQGNRQLAVLRWRLVQQRFRTPERGAAEPVQPAVDTDNRDPRPRSDRVRAELVYRLGVSRRLGRRLSCVVPEPEIDDAASSTSTAANIRCGAEPSFSTSMTIHRARARRIPA